LKCTCLNWACITHLDIWNIGYDQKKGSGIKLTIWLPTTKCLELTQFPNMQAMYNIPLESSWPGIQLCFRPHCNQRSTREVMRPKVAGVWAMGISGLPLGNPMTKCHMDVAPVERCREYYKGEGGGFPQVRVVVSLVSPRLPVARPNTKSAQIMH
jgi:hypothetical protein